jgi:hypothetical protein
VPVLVDAAGRVDAAATFAPAGELAAMGVTSLSVALGRSLRTRADIEPYLHDLVVALAG